MRASLCIAQICVDNFMRRKIKKNKTRNIKSVLFLFVFVVRFLLFLFYLVIVKDTFLFLQRI